MRQKYYYVLLSRIRMGLNHTLTKSVDFRIVSDRPAHGFGFKVK